MSSVISKIQKARAGLIIDQPFFATLLLSMPMTESHDVPTMATDGDSIIFNPDWTEKLTLAETTFVLAHEALHCVFDHMGRRANRGPNRWNQAADYIINQLLVNEKIGSMPHGGLLNPSLVNQGNGTAEGVYNLLPEEDENKKPGQSGGSMDQVNDSGSNQGQDKVDQAKLAQKSAEMRVRVVQAKNSAKVQGKLSSNLERLVDDLVQPKVDWREALRRFVSERAKTDYSFARPKRRFLYDDLFLPSLIGQRMGRITIAVDCSGSVDQKLLNEFASEINAIREDMSPSSIEVIYFDSRVCDVELFEQDQEVKLSPKGGGGTAFSPVFEYIEKQDETPTCIIVLTDLYCNDYGSAPDSPVLWCCLDIKNTPKDYLKVPFGEIIEVKL